MNFLIPYVVFALNLALFMGCSDDVIVKPPPPDPCAGKKPVSADFEIYEAPVWLPNDSVWTLYDTDTLAAFDVIFKAKEANARYYEWQIGSETITGTRTVQRNSFPRGQHEVRLIVHKIPDTICVPGDDGKDTLVRQFYIMKGTLPDNDPNSLWEKLLWRGSFYGANTDNINNKFTITLKDNAPDSGLPVVRYNAFSISNLLPDCESREHQYCAGGFKEVYFSSALLPKSCYRINGTALISQTNPDSITIKYYYYPNPNNYTEKISKVFKGLRVQ